MKKLFSAALVALFVSLSAFAQENANRDENGKVVSGPYVTNNSTWFIDVDGGVNSFIGHGQEGRHGFNVDVNVGKWFTPTVGARVGGSVGQVAVFNTASATDARFWLAGVHADFLWSLTNQFGGYKESRIWDVTLYPTFVGYVSHEKSSGVYNHELGAGLGVINSWRLCERVDLNLDLRAVATKNQIFGSVDTHRIGVIPTASLGVTVRLGKKGNTGFKRVSTVTAPLYATIADLKAKNSDLAAENAALKNSEPETITVTKTETVNVVVKSGSHIVTFKMGNASLKAVENAKLESFVNGLDKNTEITVVGSADSHTGSASRNATLASKRAEVVANTLKNLGYTNVTTSTALDVNENAEASRAAVVSF